MKTMGVILTIVIVLRARPRAARSRRRHARVAVRGKSDDPDDGPSEPHLNPSAFCTPPPAAADDMRLKIQRQQRRSIRSAKGKS
jgi:hypothetical protein